MFISMYQRHLNSLKGHIDPKPNFADLFDPTTHGTGDKKMNFQVKKLEVSRLVSLVDYYITHHSGVNELAPLSHLFDKLELLDNFVSKE